MRHYLYQKLARRYRHPAVAVVGSSVFFTLLHGLNPGMTWLAVVQLMTMSLLCCVLVHYYDALGACVAMSAWACSSTASTSPRYSTSFFARQSLSCGKPIGWAEIALRLHWRVRRLRMWVVACATWLRWCRMTMLPRPF